MQPSTLTTQTQLFFVNGLLFDKKDNSCGFTVTGLNSEVDVLSVNGRLYAKCADGTFRLCDKVKATRVITEVVGDVYTMDSFMPELLAEINASKLVSTDYSCFSLYYTFNGKTFRISDHDSYNGAKRGLRFKINNGKLTITLPNLFSIILN
jgi:hypothetical protein